MKTVGGKEAMTRILLVEDDADIVKNLACLLQQEGFDVVTAIG